MERFYLVPPGCSAKKCPRCDASCMLWKDDDGSLTYLCGCSDIEASNIEKAPIVKVYLEKQMKEFDLRPFEVKKPKVYFYKVWLSKKNDPLNNGEMTYNHPFCDNFGLFKNIEDASKVIERTYEFIDSNSNDRGYDTKEIMIERKEDLVESSKHQWQWEDIRVGWFFKTASKRHDGKSLCVKTGEYAFRWMYDFAIDEKSQDRIIYNYHNQEWDGFTKNIASITNVYDCPELAKILMIERILT